MQNNSYIFNNLIAPCGMNCGICIGYLREKNPCAGCFKKDDPNKPNQCRSCNIANCKKLTETNSGFCYDCEKHPCTRLKQLDKRYRTKYNMSMIENLDFIKVNGLDKFIRNEETRWKCSNCGETICVHRENCLKCGNSNSKRT